MPDIFFILQSFHTDCGLFEGGKYPKVEKKTIINTQLGKFDNFHRENFTISS